MSRWEALREIVLAVRRFGPEYMLQLQDAYSTAWTGMFRGYLATHAMHALLNVGLLDEFDRYGKVDVGAFAAREELDMEVLLPLCEALYSAGFLERWPGATYSLHRRARQAPQMMRGWIEVSYGYSEILHSLEPMMRRRKTYGTDFYRRSDAVAHGSGEMERWLFFPMAMDLVAGKGYRHILDLGCGDGTFLRHLCLGMPGVKGSGIDMAPAAIEDGKKRAREAGLEGRIQLLADDIGNIEQAPLSMQDIEAATAFFVLHELLYFGKDVLLRFLRSFRRLFPRAPLIVFEVIRPSAEELRQHPGIAIYYFLYHDLSQQKPVGRDSWKELFREAGFQGIEERYLPYVKSVIYILS